MDKDLLQNYVDNNYSIAQISKLTNKGKTTVRYWLTKFNLKTNNLSFSEGYALKEKIIENNTEYKICPQCNQKKELKTHYYVKNKTYTHAWCKSCNNINTIKLQQQRKKEAINYKGGKCVKCGYNKYDGALDFHHIDPSKKDFSISRKKNCSLETIKPELDKCILLCRNCHSEVHFEERCKRKK
jgi:transposase